MSSTPGKLSAAGSEDPRLGEVVGQKYRLDRLLASGGMGTVFEAEHLRLGRRVAVKLLHPDHVTDMRYVKRFHKEAQKAASLAHTGIIDVRDFGHDPVAGPYLEMELLEGASLEDVLRARGPLPVELALHVTGAALDALAVAHAHNIVHRDLKPSNLFIALGERGDACVKVLDFGIARVFTSDLEDFALEDDTFSETLTKTGVLLGTLNYMSPEQFVDARNVDHRADIYSMGATMFELLTNTPVVSGATVFECVSHVTKGRILRHPQVYRAELPRWIDALVARALALSPSDRFQSAEAMRSAITMHASIDAATARRELVEMASMHVRPAGAPVGSSADTRVGSEPSRPARRESGPLVVVADGDSGVRSAPPPGEADAHLEPSAGAAQPADDRAGRRRPKLAALRTAAIVVLSAAAGAAATAIVMGGDEPATTPRPTTEEAPREEAGGEASTSGAELTAAGATEGGDTSEGVTTAAEPPPEEGREQPEPSADQVEERSGGQSETSRRRVQRRPTPRSETRAAAQRATGTLTINTIPASRVYIDGHDTGHSTPLVDYTVPAGTHTLDLRLPDGTAHTFAVRVEAGETERVFRVLPH